MTKRALLVGINYLGTENELAGCINDSHHMHTYLTENGFTEIKLVLEKEATTSGITEALKWLTSGLVNGDVIVFHYSGHGSQLPSKIETDGFEEIICPIDLDWKTKVITDDTLREIFNGVPAGVNTTVILDCCHSGTMLDHSESLQIETSEILSEKAIELTVPAKGRFMPPPSNVAKRLKDRTLVDWSASKYVNEDALLIAGCRANQTSADAFIDGIAQGAATAAMLRILKQNNNISYKNLILEMNKFMIENGYDQRPVLDGSSTLYNNTFLTPFVQSVPVVLPPIDYNGSSIGNVSPLVACAILIILAILIAVL